MTFEALLDQAMRLSPRQRGDLANRLLESLRSDETEEVDESEWEHAWTEELGRRLANDDGQRFDLGQTLAELRATLDHRG